MLYQLWPLPTIVEEPLYNALLLGLLMATLATLSIIGLARLGKTGRQGGVGDAYLLIRREDMSFEVVRVRPSVDEYTGQLYTEVGGEKVILGQAVGLMGGAPLYTYDMTSKSALAIGRITLPEDEIRYAAWLKTNILMTEAIGKTIARYQRIIVYLAVLTGLAIFSSIVLGMYLLISISAVIWRWII